MLTKNNSEYLSKDILEEEFVKTFSLFHTVQTILGTCRVHVKNRFATVPTVYQKLYTIFSNFTASSLTFLLLYVFIEKYSNHIDIYCLSTVAGCAHLLIFNANAFHVRFLNNESNVDFLLKMQKIDRHLGIDRIQEINKILCKINRYTVACLTLLFLLILALVLSQGIQVFLASLGSYWGLFSYVVEICYCSNLIVYFYERVSFINAIIKNHLNPEKIVKPFSQKNHLSRKILFRYLASIKHSFERNETDKYLKEIINGFFQYRKLYSYQVFLLSIILVARLLFTCQYFINVLKINGRIEVWEALVFTVSLFVYLFVTVIICIRIQFFYREIKRTKFLCIMVLSQHHDGSLREKAKRMLSMLYENPPIFNVYDMWQLDARTLILLFNLVTPIVIALLQFAFV